MTALDVFGAEYGIGDNTPDRLLANARAAGAGDRLQVQVGDKRAILNHPHHPSGLALRQSAGRALTDQPTILKIRTPGMPPMSATRALVTRPSNNWPSAGNRAPDASDSTRCEMPKR